MDQERIVLGTDSRIDANVWLGYIPGRDIEIVPARIGDHARVRTGTVIYANTMIGNYLETGHNVVIREENVIGDRFSIWNNSTIDYGCKIGNNVRIHNNVYVAQLTTIEDDVFLAPGVMTANDPHPLCAKCMQGPILKKGCRIGVNVTILSHVIIGEGALIGAGSVVTRDVPPYMLAYGNPAKPSKHVDELTCQFDLVTPYINGKDVMTRAREGEILELNSRLPDNQPS
jgi:acetyltransferase-like isoleucine patch superfamily enzyme